MQLRSKGLLHSLQEPPSRTPFKKGFFAFVEPPRGLRQHGQEVVKPFIQGSTGGNQTGRGATNRLLQNKIATTNQKLLPYCKTVRTESQQTAR